MPSSSIANLMVELGLDSKGLDKGLGGVKEKLNGVTKGLTTGVGGGILKAFGATSIASIGAFTMAAGAAATAVTGTALALGKMSLDASAIEGVKSAFDGISKSAGTTGEEMLKAMQKGSMGMASAKDLMMSFNSAAQLVSVDFATQLPEAMGYLTKVAAATGQDMGFMIDSLVKGVGRMSPMILDNLGIQVNLEQATARAAEMFGKEAEALTKGELQAGMMNVTMEALAKNTAAMPDVSETAATKIAQFKTTLTDTKNELGVAFMPALLKVIDVFKGLLASGVIDKIVVSVSNFATMIVESMNSIQPLLDVGLRFISAITEGLGQMASGDISGGIQTIVENLGDFTDGLSEIMPNILTAGTEIVGALIEGFIKGLPDIIGNAVYMLGAFCETIINLLPMVLTLGLQLLLSLVTGIAQALPTLIPAAVSAFMTMFTAFVENIPMIITAGIQLILGLVQGIIAALPILISQLPVIIQSIIQAIITSLPLLFDATLQIILALVEGIIMNLPALVQAGATIIMELVAGVLEMAGLLVTLGLDLWKKLDEGLKTVYKNIKEAGVNLMKSMWEGIKSQFTSITTNFLEFFKGLIEKIKAIFNMHSPSRVMFDLGKNMMLGFNMGIDKFSTPPINATMNAMNGIPESSAGNQSSQMNAFMYPTASEIGKAVAVALMQTGALA